MPVRAGVQQPQRELQVGGEVSRLQRLVAAATAGQVLPVQILDLASILLDKRSFMSPRLECRLCFSVAHEIGHLILLRDIYAGPQHAVLHSNCFPV